MECTKFDITSYPTTPITPPAKTKSHVPAKILKLMKKLRTNNWRIRHLAQSKYITDKFTPVVVKPKVVPWVKKIPPLSQETQFYSDNISRPPVRTLMNNLKLFGFTKGRKYVRRMNKYIDYSRNSIYYYYKQKERMRASRQKRLSLKFAIKKSLSSKKLQQDKKSEEHIARLATPKKMFYPARTKKAPKIFASYVRLETFAAPKSHHVIQPKLAGVHPDALTYEPTEIIKKLAQIPKRWIDVLKPLTPGEVKKGALYFKITPRLEELSTPRQYAKAAVDESADRWVISPTALKYKATQRILDLARPIERQ